jgi:hypothetical protein
MGDDQTIQFDTQFTLSREQVASRLGDEIVIMNLQTGVYHGVEGVSAFIWNLLSHPITMGDICARVMAEYNVDEARCRADVMHLLGQLIQEGLIVRADAGGKVSEAEGR